MGIEQFPQTPNFSGKEEKFGKKQKNNKISDEEIARLRQDEVGMNHEASTEGIVDYGKPSEVNIGDGKSQEKKKRKKREKYHVRSGGRLRVTQKHWDDFEKKIKQSRQEDVLDEQQEKEDKKSKNGLATSEERQAEIDRIWAEEKKESKDDSEMMKEEEFEDVDNFDEAFNKELERLKQGDLEQGMDGENNSGNEQTAAMELETARKPDKKIEDDFKETAEEIKKMKPDEKKNFLDGLANLGYIISETKSKTFRKIYSLLSQSSTKNKFLHDYFNSYAGIYDKEAKRSEQKRKQVGKGLLATGASAGRGAGVLFKYGRVIYDAKDSVSGGLRRLNPFRHVTAAAMFVGRSAEAAKETRFKYDSVKEKARVKDEEKAMEEALKIYEKVYGEEGLEKFKKGKKASESIYTEKGELDETKAEEQKEKFIKAYKDSLPEDLKNRLNKIDMPAYKWWKIYFDKSKDTKIYVQRLMKKIDKIDQNHKLSPKEKEIKKQRLLQRNEALLNDLDRMVGDDGTIDNISYYSRMAEKVGKGVATALIVDSVYRIAKAGWELSHVLGRVEDIDQGDEMNFSKADKDVIVYLDKMPKADKDYISKHGLSSFLERKQGMRLKEMLAKSNIDAGRQIKIPADKETAESFAHYQSDEKEMRGMPHGDLEKEIPQGKSAAGGLNETAKDKETAESFAHYQSDEEEMRGLPHGDLEKEIPQGKSAAGGLNETAKDKETAESFAHYESDEKEMNGLPDRADLEPEAVKSDVAGNLRVSSDGGLKEFEQAHNLLKQTGAEVKMDGGKISAVYEIGQKGDFKHLDQALRRIVVDKMDFGTDNKMDALEAARAENTLANLRQLIEGHNVAGMKSADFKGIVNFDEKTGQFRINDYAEFEKKLGSLIDHANANINANSDAVAYVDDTSHKAWQEMLDQKTAGKSRILADNFDNNKLVENAEQRISAQAKDFGNEDVIDSKPGNTVNEFERGEQNQLVSDDIDTVAAADKMGETIAKSAGPRDIDLNLEKPDIILGDNIKNYIDAHPEIMGDGSGRLNESNAEVVSKIVEQNPNINEHPEMLKTVLNNYNIIKNIPDPKLQTSMITLLYNPSRESVHELFKKAGVEIGGRLRDVTAFNRDGNLILHYDMKWAPDIDVIMDKSGKAYVDGPFGWNDSFKSLKNLKNVLMRPLELLGKMEKPINPGH